MDGNVSTRAPTSATAVAETSPAIASARVRYVLAPGVAAFVRGPEGMVLMSARAVWRAPTASCVTLFRLFATARSREEALGLVGPGDRATLEGVIDSALSNGFLIDAGLANAGNDATRWLEPHDVIFHRHTRTRLVGQGLGPRIETIPREQFGMEDADAESIASPGVALDAPDAADARLAKLSLRDALLSRRTRYSRLPVGIGDLGALLYWSCRTTEEGAKWPGGNKRNYPSGGGVHSLTIYVVARACTGLDRGLYRFVSDGHRLAKIADWRPELDRIVAEAGFVTGGACPEPPVMLIAAADVRRVVAKYQGVAYSLILKEVGAWMQTVYLVGTALRLAPAAIGFSDASVLAALLEGTGRVDVSVGEMILGG